jgi:hypothetical protein
MVKREATANPVPNGTLICGKAPGIYEHVASDYGPRFNPPLTIAWHLVGGPRGFARHEPSIRLGYHSGIRAIPYARQIALRRGDPIDSAGPSTH